MGTSTSLFTIAANMTLFNQRHVVRFLRRLKMIFEIKSLFIHLCITLLCFWSSKAYAEKSAPAILLKGRSYALKADLIIENSRSSLRYEVEEIYSAWQQRSRVKYRTISGPSKQYKNSGDQPDTLVIYADAKKAIVVDAAKRVCTEASNVFADRIFKLNMDAHSPIIGPSRFLQYAQANGPTARDESVNGKIGDKPKMIKYDYTVAGEEELFALLYSEKPSDNLPNGIPLELRAEIKPIDDYMLTYVTYVFKRFEILSNAPLYGSVDSTLRNYGLKGDSIEFDRLAIEPAIGCAKVLDSVSDITEKLQTTEYRFSFRAQVSRRSMPEVVQSFVGYEPSISTLRADQQTPNRLTTTLTNFYAKLFYHMIKRLGSSDVVFDSVLRVRENDRLDNDLSCVVTRAPATLKAGGGPPLGEMLFGSDKFVAVGVARVRGIETRVYESFNSSWPIWMQQPIQYHTTSEWISISDETRVRPSMSYDSNVVLNVVIYLSHSAESGGGEGGIFENEPVLIEIYKLDARTLLVLDKITIPVYDFRWKLSMEGPDGLNVEQFFALGDACTPLAVDDNHYGRIDLLLRRDWPLDETHASPHWLAEPARRNFAIMRAAQEMCDLPASLIYDIESKFGQSPQISSSGVVISISATMRVAEHTRKLVQLVYIARGEIPRDSLKKFRHFLVTSFQVCYFTAAHQEIDTVFAYEPEQMSCFMYLEPVVGKVVSTIQSNFKIRSGPLEIYRIHHARAPNSKGADELTNLARSHGRISQLDNLKLVDPRDKGAWLDVKLKSFEVTELNQKDPYQIDDLAFASSNGFKGFGLLIEDGQNRFVGARHLHTNTWSGHNTDERHKFENLLSGMTFGQCQAECLADFDCQSYSVCLRAGELECILSKVSFKTPMLVLQLLQIQDKKAKLGEKFGLYTASSGEGDAMIHVKRHPGCELHNKIYLNLFGPVQQVEASLHQRRLHAVSGREHCARICVHSSVQILQADVHAARQASLSVFTRPESNATTIADLFRDYKSSHLNLCTTFMYLSMDEYDRLDGDKARLMSYLIGTNEEEITNGYCIVGETASQHEIAQLNKAGVHDRDEAVRMIPVERYQFDFTFMFETQEGVSLVQSPMSERESSAYTLITGKLSEKKTREAYEMMKSFMDRGENIGYYSLIDPPGRVAHCARVCFMQFTPMWPGCKSFDVFEVAINNRKRTLCFFNSISARDALRSERFDLIRSDPNAQPRVKQSPARVVHYEPRSGFISSSLDFATQLEGSADAAGCIASDNSLRVGSFALSCTMLIALLLGVGTGTRLGLRVLRRVEETVQDEEILIERPTLKFKNLVNFEGLIVSELESDVGQDKLNNRAPN